MRRIALFVSVAAMIAIAPTTSASAGSPVREYQPLPPRIVLHRVCPDFGIVADILVNEEYATTFSDAQGDPVRTIVTGRLVVRLTNPDSGASIVRNISGPGETVFHADGSSTLRARGTWFLFYTEGQLGSGSRATSFINHGYIVLDNHADGTTTIRSTVGTSEDLCATLA
jgi:hypothetical protein